MAERTGDYPIDATNAAELERLHRQDEAWAADTALLLDRIGIGPGSRCLDLGCGPRGLTRELARRAGPDGQVVGLEYNPDFVAVARQGAPANVEIVQGDAYKTGFPDAGFDFVHMRFLASTSGEIERLTAEAIRLLRPGGWLAMQEADASPMACYPPNAACERLVSALHGLFPSVTGDYPAAHRLYGLLRAGGLQDVGYRPALVGVRSGDPWQDYLPQTALSVARLLAARGLMSAEEMDEAVAECRAHLSRPDTVFVSYMLVQLWGRKPQEPEV